MYIYVKADTRGVVKDYEHVDTTDNTDGIKVWSMKFYDDKTNNPDLESQGYVKTYLIESFYQTFETYFDLFTIVDGQLMLPTNIPEPTAQTLQAQMANQDANSRQITADNKQIIEDNANLKEQLSEILSALKSGDK